MESSLCEVVLYSGEFFVQWSCIMVSSLCAVVLYSGEFFVLDGPVFDFGGVKWPCILASSL